MVDGATHGADAWRRRRRRRNSGEGLARCLRAGAGRFRLSSALKPRCGVAGASRSFWAACRRVRRPAAPARSGRGKAARRRPPSRPGRPPRPKVHRRQPTPARVRPWRATCAHRSRGTCAPPAAAVRAHFQTCPEMQPHAAYAEVSVRRPTRLYRERFRPQHVAAPRHTRDRRRTWRSRFSGRYSP